MWTLCRTQLAVGRGRTWPSLRCALPPRSDFISVRRAGHAPALELARARRSRCGAERYGRDFAPRSGLVAFRLHWPSRSSSTLRATGRRGRARCRPSTTWTVTGSPMRMPRAERVPTQRGLELVELPPVAAQPAHGEHALVAVAEGDERAGADDADDLARRTPAASRARTARARAGRRGRCRRPCARSTSRRARAASTRRRAPRAAAVGRRPPPPRSRRAARGGRRGPGSGGSAR